MTIGLLVFTDIYMGLLVYRVLVMYSNTAHVEETPQIRY